MTAPLCLALGVVLGLLTQAVRVWLHARRERAMQREMLAELRRNEPGSV